MRIKSKPKAPSKKCKSKRYTEQDVYGNYDNITGILDVDQEVVDHVNTHAPNFGFSKTNPCTKDDVSDCELETAIEWDYGEQYTKQHFNFRVRENQKVVDDRWAKYEKDLKAYYVWYEKNKELVDKELKARAEDKADKARASLEKEKVAAAKSIATAEKKLQKDLAAAKKLIEKHGA